MAKICTISDKESDSSDDARETQEADLSTPKTQRGALTARHRNHSVNEEDLHEAAAGRGEGAGEDGYSFRRRTHSAPPAVWVAKKYGRELRKMSDEFDTLLDKGQIKRTKSAGTARQMHASPSWLSFLWSHQESEAETSGSRTVPDTRPAA